MLPHRSSPTNLRALKLLYLFVMVLSFYFLFVSRSSEVYTVWGVLHPAFMPTFMAATLILLTMIFSAERVEYKVLFTILHSVLSHVFMVVVFPAGNIGVQQVILGESRLVFNNAIPNGFGWSEPSVLLKVYILFRGENLQTAFSVIFARMFGVDVYWTHLLLVPLLWGIFVPVIGFAISRILGASEKVSVLTGLLVSSFPTSIAWGKESIPNGLSYLFFFCFIYFLLKLLKSNKLKDLPLVVTFFLASFLSHFLAGTVAFSILLLAYGIRTYKKERRRARYGAKLTLLVCFAFSASILPFLLVYRRFFYPWANTQFSLQPLYSMSPAEALFSTLLGNYFGLISREAYITALTFGVAPLVGFIGMVYVLVTSSKRGFKRSIDPCVLLLFLGIALIAINDRILRLFMIDVPFSEAERLWVLRDFLLVSFLAFFIARGIQEIRLLSTKASDKLLHLLRRASSALKLSKRTYSANLASLTSASVHFVIFLIISGWVTASIYYAYPHWAPMQTTTYELEAVKCIDQTTSERYIVVGDQWIIFAGQMFVGINNPQAFYFSHTDPRGVSLFVKMKNNPTNETLIEAMKINNAIVAYFIIEKPRLGAETYNNIINKAQQNNLQTYKIFYYPEGEEKLYIFRYKTVGS